MKKSNEKLREIQQGYFRVKNEVVPIGFILMCLMFSVGLSFIYLL